MRISNAMRVDTMIDQKLIEEPELDEGSSSTYLTFDLGGQTLGVRVHHVREIIDCQKITRLPNAPADVLGVVDVRGASVPLIDLQARLGIVEDDLSEEARIVVLEIVSSAGTRPLGIMANRVRNVEQIARDEIEAVPNRGLGGWNADALEGLCRRGNDLVVLIDLARILGTGNAEHDLAAGMDLL